MSADLQIRITASDSASGVLKGLQATLGGIGSAVTAPVRALGGVVDVLGKIGLAGMGLKAVGDTIAGAVQGLVGDAIAAEQISKATEAVVKSTRGVAGMSAEAVADLAGELSKVIPIEDEAIQSAENLLLTFTGVGKEVFPQATEASLNMAVALGQDASQAALMLGKALNDPVKGVGALRRVGVQLTDAQKDLVGQLVKTGDVAGAQKVILKELETEFGGAARAAGQTFAGKLTILQTQIGNVKESIGGALLPVLSRLLDWAGPLVSAFGEKVPGALQTAADTVQAVLGYLDPGNKRDLMREWFGDAGPVIDEVVRGVEDLADTLGYVMETGDLGAIPVALSDVVLPAVGRALRQLGDLFVAWIGPMIPPLLAQLGQLAGQLWAWVQRQAPVWLAQLQAWGQALWQWIAPQIPVVLGWLAQLVNQVWVWVQGQAPVWLTQLQTWGSALWGWIAPMIPPLLAKLGELAGQAWSWVQGQAPLWLAQLQSWGQQLIAWIAPMIPPLLAKLGELAGQLWAWIQAQARPLLERLGAWATQFGAWIAPAALQFLQEWPGILDTLLDQIGAAVGPLLKQLGEWAIAFVSWIVPMLPGLAITLWSINFAILAFIAETVGTIAAKLLIWGAEFVKWIAPQIPPLLLELGKVLLKLGEWILTTGVPKLAEIAFNLGKALITGMVNALAGLATALMGAIRAELNKVRVDVGPFHLSAGSGLTIDMPGIGGVAVPGTGLPGFALGGVVPGPVGAPTLAVVHGGETVTPPGEGRGGVSIVCNFYGPTDASAAKNGVLSAARQLGLGVA